MTKPTDQTTDRLLTRSDVEKMTALSASSIKRRVKDGRMPAPIVLGPNAHRWKLSEIQEWVACLVKAS